MWPEMNRYIKQILAQEMGDVEFDVVVHEDHWEIRVDGKRVVEIGVAFVSKEELPASFGDASEEIKLN